MSLSYLQDCRKAIWFLICIPLALGIVVVLLSGWAIGFYLAGEAWWGAVAGAIVQFFAGVWFMRLPPSPTEMF